MADETKRRKRSKTTSGRHTESAVNRRYTPPAPQEFKQTPRWVPIFMFGFFALGVAVIILNYLPNSPLLPSSIAGVAISGNWYLLIGLGLICIGFIFATRYE